MSETGKPTYAHDSARVCAKGGMAPSSASNTVSENISRGIDRATFNVYDHAKNHVAGKSSPNSSDEQVESGKSHGDASYRARSPHRLAEFRAKAKTKTKEIFHRTREEHTPSESPAVTLAPQPSSMMENDRLYNPLPKSEGMQPKDLVHHPIDTVQSALHGASGAKFAEVMDNQVIAHGANVGLVRAWDRLESAQNEEEKTNALNELETLKKERQDSYVRWTMDRHVLKVRQDPPRTLKHPQREDYRKVDKDGIMMLDWTGYGQHVRKMCLYFVLQNTVYPSFSLVRGSRLAFHVEPKI